MLLCSPTDRMPTGSSNKALHKKRSTNEHDSGRLAINTPIGADLDIFDQAKLEAVLACYYCITCLNLDHSLLYPQILTPGGRNIFVQDERQALFTT